MLPAILTLLGPVQGVSSPVPSISVVQENAAVVAGKYKIAVKLRNDSPRAIRIGIRDASISRPPLPEERFPSIGEGEKARLIFSLPEKLLPVPAVLLPGRSHLFVVWIPYRIQESPVFCNVNFYYTYKGNTIEFGYGYPVSPVKKKPAGRREETLK